MPVPITRQTERARKTRDEMAVQPTDINSIKKSLKVPKHRIPKSKRSKCIWIPSITTNLHHSSPIALTSSTSSSISEESI